MKPDQGTLTLKITGYRKTHKKDCQKQQWIKTSSIYAKLLRAILTETRKDFMMMFNFWASGTLYSLPDGRTCEERWSKFEDIMLAEKTEIRNCNPTNKEPKKTTGATTDKRSNKQKKKTVRGKWQQ
ncbi:Hypothetical predicted protein [Xyrichtys novacula]|uniref:Uncharacterized protein n=1 Tax=Xyrichtys novacula TaxID=13765 RepID=A0AAV1F2V0_XYRNO|nr:Hypothetical predicted protein [Xyrichtys novacula]